MRERRAKVNFGDLKNEVAGKKFEKDVRIFKLEADKEGNATAIIRFLPSPDSDVPFVKIYSHSFKSEGGFYYENCPTTFGEPCPACKQNNVYWNNEQEDIARERKRKLDFYANILVIKDDNCPERAGKVFIYRFGKKIMNKIQEAIEGKIESAFNPFDYYEGANFILTQKIVAGYNNYDSSRFKDPTPISSNEEFIDTIDKQLYELKPFSDKSKFKSYDKLVEIYAKKTGIKVESDGSQQNYTDADVDSELEGKFGKSEVQESNDPEEMSTAATEVVTSTRSKIFDKLKNKNKA